MTAITSCTAMGGANETLPTGLGLERQRSECGVIVPFLITWNKLGLYSNFTWNKLGRKALWTLDAGSKTLDARRKEAGE